MFGVSFPELLLIFVVVLIVFGPEKLPEIARTIGKLAGDLKRGSDSVRREFYNTVYTPAAELDRNVKREIKAVKEDALKPEASPPGSAKGDSSGKTEESIDRKIEGEKE